MSYYKHEQSSLPPYSKEASGPWAPPSYNLKDEVARVLAEMKDLLEGGLEMLGDYDTVIVVDDSGSMTTENRWNDARDALRVMAEVVTLYDKDGIDLYFLNARLPESYRTKNLKSATEVMKLFNYVGVPRGQTYIGRALYSIVNPYLEQMNAVDEWRSKGGRIGGRGEGSKRGREEGSKRWSRGSKQRTIFGKLFGKSETANVGVDVELAIPKKLNILFITDGIPNDPEDVENAIRKVVAAVTPPTNWPVRQIGIQFVQVGSDQRAKAWLKSLDDDKSEKFGADIVDTRPYTGERLSAELLLSVLLGAIDRTTDREGGAHFLEDENRAGSSFKNIDSKENLIRRTS